MNPALLAFAAMVDPKLFLLDNPETQLGWASSEYTTNPHKPSKRSRRRFKGDKLPNPPANPIEMP